MKLCIGLSYFNDIKSLKRLCESLPADMPIIAIDGRYSDFEWPHDFSKDGSTEYLLNRQYTTIDFLCAPQIEKRQRYLDIAALMGYDFLIVLDSDDYIHPDYQDWDKLYKELGKQSPNEYLFNLWSWISPLWVKNWNVVPENQFVMYTRILRPDKILYDTAHWTHVARDKPDTFIIANKVIEGVRFTSDSTLRSKEFIDAGFKWAHRQMLTEDDKMKKAGSKRINLWLVQLQKALAVPGTKVIEQE